HDLGALAIQVLERGARRARDPVVQVDVGEAGDANAVEGAREARNRDVVPCDVDRGGLDEEPVAQGGGAEGAGRRGEEVAAGDHGAISAGRRSRVNGGVLAMRLDGRQEWSRRRRPSQAPLISLAPYFMATRIGRTT